ncbi:TRAP transporter small permease subunit [Tritonibacter horizontis]|uniref:TRAP transporter small permease protein n=1 Tax=Tritonibacter horizontis TaxID=1768241 RepID=A0A132C2X7_9RHOB|nr:TRAP transporter small permease [Tritonibacter horizontis]KUP94582.1 tripartite ATP-independent periplasmic transporter, DctQ component [Tritonibacter horizontis]
MTGADDQRGAPVVKSYRCLHRAASRPVHIAALGANATGTLMVLALVGIVNYDMLARTLANQPLRGTIELVQFAMVLIVFLQLPDVIRAGRLTRSDGFLGLLATRAPRAAGLLQRLIDLLSFAVMALLAVASFPVFIEMWHSQDYFGIPGVFTAPWWPIKLTVLASAALCAIIFALKVLGPGQEQKN